MMDRLIWKLCAWWRLRRLPAWAEADRQERTARARGDTRAIGRAREAKRRALNDNLMPLARGR